MSRLQCLTTRFNTLKSSQQRFPAASMPPKQSLFPLQHLPLFLSYRIFLSYRKAYSCFTSPAPSLLLALSALSALSALARACLPPLPIAFRRFRFLHCPCPFRLSCLSFLSANSPSPRTALPFHRNHAIFPESSHPPEQIHQPRIQPDFLGKSRRPRTFPESG